MKILVADDNLPIRMSLQFLLSDYGECTFAADGQEAVDTFSEALKQKEPFHLVIMDIMMPVMDGMHAVQEIMELEERSELEEGQRACVVMLSCLDDSEHMLQAQYGCGAHAYLTKPLDEDLLQDTLINLGLLEAPLPFEAMDSECDR